MISECLAASWRPYDSNRHFSLRAHDNCKYIFFQCLIQRNCFWNDKVDSRYKLISFYEYGKWELYDLLNDPHELKNLIGNPAMNGEINRLKKRLEELKSGYGL